MENLVGVVVKEEQLELSSEEDEPLELLSNSGKFIGEDIVIATCGTSAIKGQIADGFHIVEWVKKNMGIFKPANSVLDSKLSGLPDQMGRFSPWSTSNQLTEQRGEPVLPLVVAVEGSLSSPLLGPSAPGLRRRLRRGTSGDWPEGHRLPYPAVVKAEEGWRTTPSLPSPWFIWGGGGGAS
ncbi:hypothetical protein Sjap_026037 [Stephania japonica]|uniref:Uncharacterized protein n=1 Tax=Stephania japonica TaxID=461633 RepID=A0AAP0E2W1_9MAGN